MSNKKPVTVIRAQAVRTMKDALEKHGYKVMRETWDGGSQTESFEVRSRGVDTLIIVADPAYLSEPEPNPMRGPHKERAVGPRQGSRRPTGSSLAASDEAAAFSPKRRAPK